MPRRSISRSDSVSTPGISATGTGDGFVRPICLGHAKFRTLPGSALTSAAQAFGDGIADSRTPLVRSRPLGHGTWDGNRPHHLTAITRACEARTGFGKLPVQLNVGLADMNGRFPSGGRPFFVRKRHGSTLQSGCATVCLTMPKTGSTLDIANMAGREDHS